MKFSLSTLKMVLHPSIRPLIERLAQQGARAALTVPTAIIDSSTGVAAATVVAVPLPGKFTHVDGQSDLAQLASFNTAAITINNGIAVLAEHLSVNGNVKLNIPAITGGDGVIAVSGTVPAATKTVTGVDGATATALGRLEAGSALSALRNNLATVVRAYNALAVAIGVDTLTDNSGGKPTLTDYTLVNRVVAATGVAAAGDAASKAAVDAALTALANDIATVAAKINTSLFVAGTINNRNLVTLVP